MLASSIASVMPATSTAPAAAGVAAGVVSLAASAPAGPHERLRLGVIGVRNRGRELAGILAAMPDVEVRVLCDVDAGVFPSAAALVVEQGRPAPQCEREVRRVLDDPQIDAVVIATPHHWHAPIALAALQAGKHVYVEKPASHVYREGQLLIRAAEKYRRVLKHGTQMRSREVTAKAREVIRSGILGEVKMAKAWNVQRHSHRRDLPPRCAATYNPKVPIF